MVIILENLSIEDPEGRDAYIGIIAQQWNQLYPQAALDEVQKSPRLVESIKAAYNCFSDVRDLLLGSSHFRSGGSSIAFVRI